MSSFLPGLARSNVWFYCQLPSLREKALQNGSHLSSRRCHLRLKGVCGDAADESFGYCPAHGFFCPGAWLVGVGCEAGSVAHVFALVRRVVHEDGGELFSGDGGVWREIAVAGAAGDAAGGGPVHGGGVPKFL